jgi:hypothetical protein
MVAKKTRKTRRSKRTKSTHARRAGPRPLGPSPGKLTSASRALVRPTVPASDTWPTEAEWRQSGLCDQAQADGVPCTVVGRRCELCEHAAATATAKDPR